jgi:hypothetical protein
MAIAGRPRVGRVPGHGGARNPEPGLHVPELAVAVRGLVEVHEVHVDGRPRQRLVGLGVQVQQRLAERLQAADPHLGRGERVHPGDHADAVVVGVRGDHGGPDAGRVGQHRTPHDPQRHLLRPVQPRDHLLRLGGDLGERVLAVQALAAGQEPDLATVEGIHVRSASGRLP